jgi:hypothetical protein
MMARLLVLVLLVLTSPLAFAVRPFMTDDARIGTAQSCQLESWMRVYRKSTETWNFPACNLTGNLEITGGGGHARYDGQPSSNDYVLQGKTMLKVLEPNSYGVALAVGRIYHPAATQGPNSLGNNYAYMPVSFSLLDDRLVIHNNLGWLRDNLTKQDNLTWGTGGEYVFNPRISMMAETYGDNRNHPYWQVGLRGFIVPGKVQVDATFGNQRYGDRDTQWFSIGLRLTPDRLF